MPVFAESRLQFDFDDHFWTRLKKVDGHVDYKKLEILNGSKAIDFLGFCGETLFFLEIKNRTRKAGEDLVLEIGKKVKDTVATMVGGARNSTNEKSDWKYFISHLVNGHDIMVVFWMEEGNPIVKRNKAGLGFYTNSLKIKLKWLTGGGNHVMVIDSFNTIKGLTVTNLPN